MTTEQPIDAFTLGELARMMRLYRISRLVTAGTTIELGPEAAPVADSTTEADRVAFLKEQDAMLYAASEGFPR